MPPLDLAPKKELGPLDMFKGAVLDPKAQSGGTAGGGATSGGATSGGATSGGGFSATAKEVKDFDPYGDLLHQELKISGGMGGGGTSMFQGWKPPPPPPPQVTVEPNQIKFDGVILFKKASAALEENPNPILDAIAAVIKANPQLGRVRVDGHASSEGTETYNQKLSEDRAASVVAYLVAKGVPADRLTSKGFGESQPVASNDTEESRAKNRRVVFTLLDGPVDPTKVTDPSKDGTQDGTPKTTGPTSGDQDGDDGTSSGGNSGGTDTESDSDDGGSVAPGGGGGGATTDDDGEQETSDPLPDIDDEDIGSTSGGGTPVTDPTSGGGTTEGDTNGSPVGTSGPQEDPKGPISTQRIHFGRRSAALNTKAKKVIIAIGQRLAKNPDLTIEVEGHTDSKKSAAYNLKLSKKRANVTASYLRVFKRKKGMPAVSADRVTVLAKGETKPIASNKKKAGRDKNRRVEFRVFGKVAPVPLLKPKKPLPKKPLPKSPVVAKKPASNKPLPKVPSKSTNTSGPPVKKPVTIVKTGGPKPTPKTTNGPIILKGGGWQAEFDDDCRRTEERGAEALGEQGRRAQRGVQAEEPRLLEGEERTVGDDREEHDVEVEVVRRPGEVLLPEDGQGDEIRSADRPQQDQHAG
jgi:outer membrane protein OmpA-like peptidoglycan-associated protein